MEYTGDAVGIREAKNNFSALTAQVNNTGAPLTVLKNGRPWVVISPADIGSAKRRKKLEALRKLTAQIESDALLEPAWDEHVSDRELLAQERVRRFG